MGVLVLLASFLALTHAGRLPYLGGDIDEVIQSSKQKDLTDPSAAWIVANQRPVEPKPITQKQKRDSTNYNSKFTDIARAYAEGYKAAIKAVQQRALIAKRRLHTMGKPLPLRPSANFLPPPLFARSEIPQAPQPNTPEILNLQPEAPITAKSTIPLPQTPEQIPGVGVGEVAPVSSPSPSSDRETNLPTLNGLPDTQQSGKEEMVARSTIPEAPKEEKKSDVPTGESSPSGMFAAAVSAQTTENAVEKSWIPGSRGSGSDSALNMNERSTVVEMPKYTQEDHPAFPHVPVHMRNQEDRDKIAKLNARARHRNIYFDGAGGDPFNGGGVLSRQNAISVTKKHRRRRRRSSDDDWYFVPNPHYLARHRRSHMPYLGQNLDAMGVVRATPKSWTSAQVRKSIADAKAKQQFLPATQAAYNVPSTPEVAPSPFTQSMPAQFRADIPQPPMMSNPMALNFAGNLPGGMPGPMFAPPNGQFYRSMIPSYPPFFNQMPGPFGYAFQAPPPAGLINEEPASAESAKSPEAMREKKSTIPTPGDFDHEAVQTVNFNA